MIILALDQSTRISGWAVFDNSQLKSFGHWSETSEDIGKRFLNIKNNIKQKVEQYQPDKIIFENIQLQNGGQNVGTFQKLAQLQGMIMILCEELQIPYEIVYASEWRKSCDFLKGNDKHRNEQKKITQQWVKDTFGLKCTQDEADAICIGYHATIKSEDFYDWS